MTYQRANTESGETLSLVGEVRRDAVPELLRQLLAAASPGRRLTVDLAQVQAMDSAAVAALLHGWRRVQATGAQIELGGRSEAASQALQAFRAPPAPPATPRRPGAMEALGADAIGALAGALALVQLAADVTFELIGALLRPRRLRVGALVEQMSEIGARALPIVGLITFLVGLTVASQSARQLEQFGAAIFVADLTAVSMVLEMGPLMTAILVAGRSGASIAAEVATMSVSEELDALRVMGVDPLRYLAVPRLLALIVVLPMLTIIADALGMLGGFLVGVLYLDIAWNAFLNQMLAALTPWDVVRSLTKSVAFAWGIGLVALHQGLRARGGASEVGRTTTTSVVVSIFYIIVANCAFSVLFYMVL